MSRNKATHPPATYVAQMAILGLGILGDVADVIPGPVKPIVTLVQRAITIAEASSAVPSLQADAISYFVLVGDSSE